MGLNKLFEALLVVIFSCLIGMFGAQRSVWAEFPAEGWSWTYGGQSEDIAHALVQTSDGGYALAGGTRSRGAGGSDVWLVRTDASGNVLWNGTYGGARDDWAEALVQSNDGGFAMAGLTSSYGAGGNDFWLTKIDADGNALWNKTFGGIGDDVAEALVQTSDGGYAIAGPTQSFGAGYYDFWLIRTDALGNALWNKTYGGAWLDWAEALIQTKDGGFAITGATGSFGAGNIDVWLVKTDALGNVKWNETYGGPRDDMAHALIETDAGYAIASYVESYGAGMSDFWLVKTDALGNAQWNKTYGGTRQDWPQAMVRTDGGGYAIAGYTESYSAGGSDFWFVRTDSLGNALWNKTYGGSNDDWAEALVLCGDGGYALAGRTASYGAGGYDFWFLKTDDSGVVPEFTQDFIIIPIVLVTSIAFRFFSVKKESGGHARS